MSENVTENIREVWNRYRYAAVNCTLAVLQVIFYLLNAALGGALYAPLALHAGAVLQGHQYWRLFTVMLMHADLTHLLSNLLGQIFIGNIVEQNLGHARFGLLYFLCLAGGSACSVLHAVTTGWNGWCVGSSGAVFGLMGALAVLILKGFRKYDSRRSLPQRALFMLVYAVYSGSQSASVDNAAHVGGLITGLLAGIILSLGIDPDLRRLL